MFNKMHNLTRLEFVRCRQGHLALFHCSFLHAPVALFPLEAAFLRFVQSLLEIRPSLLSCPCVSPFGRPAMYDNVLAYEMERLKARSFELMHTKLPNPDLLPPTGLVPPRARYSTHKSGR